MLVNNLKAVIYKNQITPYQLSKTCGLPRRYVYNIKNNERKLIGGKGLDLFCKYLNCSIDDLIIFKSNQVDFKHLHQTQIKQVYFSNDDYDAIAEEEALVSNDFWSIFCGEN
jgi:DNA-binding Xre family transcriptional regulator